MSRADIRRALAGMLLLMAAALPARADFDRRAWQYYKEIKPEPRAGQYAQVILDRDVLCNSAGNLDDIRILDGGDQEVPYKLTDDRGETSEERQAAEILNKSAVKGKYSSFVLDLGKPGTISNRIEISTPGVNFTRKVTIEGSQDGLGYATLRDNAYIFDFSRDYHARSTSVSYPDSTYRYLRLKIWNYGDPALQIDGATVYWRKMGLERETLIYSGMGRVTQNTEERSTDIVIDPRCGRIPGGRIVITSSGTNYHRWVEISGSKDRENWYELSSGSVLKYNTPKFKGEESSVGYPGSDYPYLRIRIRNYDDRPITVLKIDIYTSRRRAFFPYESGSNYRLYYGNPDAAAPIYDIQETFKYLQSEQALNLPLGPELKNQAYVRPIATAPWLESHPWVLWVVLAAAVVIIGALIIRLGIQMRPTPPSDEQ